MFTFRTRNLNHMLLSGVPHTLKFSLKVIFILVCVRSLDGQLKCFDVPDLVEKSKIIQKRTKRIMAKIKKISLKPSSALDGAKKLGSSKIKPKQRVASFKKALRNSKVKLKSQKSKIL